MSSEDQKSVSRIQWYWIPSQPPAMWGSRTPWHSDSFYISLIYIYITLLWSCSVSFCTHV